MKTRWKALYSILRVGTLFLAVLLKGAASHYINFISRTADPFLDGKQQPILLSSSLLRSLVMSEFEIFDSLNGYLVKMLGFEPMIHTIFFYVDLATA